MASTTDLFKFVAVRPAQLLSPADDARTVVRDQRAATADGLQLLLERVRKIGTVGDALAEWRQLDLSSIDALAWGQREVVRIYEASSGQTTPAAETVLKGAGVADLLSGASKQFEPTWDALYVAHATGTDAGPRLESPVAALRLLHFASLLASEPEPTVPQALAALSATVVLASELDVAPGAMPGVGSPVASPLSSPERSAQLGQLASELHASNALLSALSNAPAATGPAIEAGSPQPAGEWSQGQFSVSTIPALRAALPADLTPTQAGVLDRLGVTQTTPVPSALDALQADFNQMTDRALSLVGDSEFQALLHTDSIVASAQLAPPPDVDVSGRITPLGIGDLKVVKQTLLAYVPGEVAHIENILKGESNERKHRNLDWTETTVTTVDEETRDTERDTQSTDRFELKREAEQTSKEDMSIKAGLNVTASYGPVVATATGDFAYATAKTDSQKSSSNFAHEVIDRSITKVQTKTQTTRSTTSHSEAEETTTHGVDNHAGTEHVIGVYRWVDKRYRAQVYNYGVRLMLEFVVPEPAAFYRAARSAPVYIDVTPPEPFLNDINLFGKLRRLNASDITETTYQRYAARYGASGVTPPPATWKYISATIAKDSIGDGLSVAMASKDFAVPPDYQLAAYSATMAVLWINHPKFTLQIAGDQYTLLNDPSGGNAQLTAAAEPGHPPGDISVINGPVPLSVSAYDAHAFAVNVQGVCKVAAEALTAWQLQTYEKILTAYQAQQTVYDQKVAQARASGGITIQGQDPATNRTVEQTELKKLCIEMMTGQHFSQFHAVSGPPTNPEVDIYEALREGPIIQFLEQAFEWEQITYIFYPYIWGNKDNWVTVSNLSDPDPLFQQFLTAGSCRVLVPVPLAYADAVKYLLQSKNPDLAQKVWGGSGEPLTLDSPLYIAIADEIRNQTDDLAGATPEGDPWEYTLPTTLVWLQPDSTLPTFT
jgi:hypothetical protein